MNFVSISPREGGEKRASFQEASGDHCRFMQERHRVAVRDGASVFGNDRYPSRIVSDEFYQLRPDRLEDVSTRTAFSISSAFKPCGGSTHLKNFLSWQSWKNYPNFSTIHFSISSMGFFNL